MSFKIHIFGKVKHRHSILKSQLNKPTKLDCAIPQPGGGKGLSSQPLSAPPSRLRVSGSAAHSSAPSWHVPPFQGPFPEHGTRKPGCASFTSLPPWEPGRKHLTCLIFCFLTLAREIMTAPQAPGWPCGGVTGVSTCRRPSPGTLVTRALLCANAIVQ